MEKLYKVLLKNTEDGGHVIGETLFATAKEARKEFLRIRKLIFEGFCYDKPDEYNFRNDNHFINYYTSDLNLSIKILKIGSEITFPDHEEDKQPYYKLLFNETDDPCVVSIDEIFSSAVEIASRTWSFDEGFKQIYNFVKRRLFDSFIRCEYSKGCGTQPEEMHYFVKAIGGQEAIISVQKNIYDRSYTYHINI